MGVAFILEAVDVWGSTDEDLPYVGPLALVLAGVAVVIGSLSNPDRRGSVS